MPIETSQTVTNGFSGELTAREAQDYADQLKRKAATDLGMMLFAYGELERDLSLCVVWMNEGAGLEVLTREIVDFSMDKKIEVLRRLVKQNLSYKPEIQRGFEDWIGRIDGIRMMRNRLAHGRWWFDPHSGEIVNISGIPTSPKQNEERYAEEGIEIFVKKIRSLQKDLQKLRRLDAD